MNRCKDCKWWQFNPNHDEIWGSCKLTQRAEPNQWNLQKCATHEWMGEYNIPKSRLAWAMDHEDYQAILRTHPDFGCVQWEAKE